MIVCLCDTHFSYGTETRHSLSRECKMLVLTRKPNEKICIGDSITITVLRMKGNAVRLGIEAPDSCNILRGELVFEQENAEASSEDEPSFTPTVSLTRVARAKRSTGAMEAWPVEKNKQATELGVSASAKVAKPAACGWEI